MKLPDHWFFGRATSQESVYAFDAEEAAHATRALRLAVGDGLQWLDGAGNRFSGEILAVSRSGFTAFAKTHSFEPAVARIHLSVGVLHDATRLEWLIEKATELGVTEVSLLETNRVQRPRYRLARLEAKATAAMKQSGRAWLPPIREREFSDMLAPSDPGNSAGELRLLAHCYTDLPRAPLWEVLAEADLNAQQPTPASVTLLIGPEGDFTREEVQSLEQANFRSVSLGAARLRSETAAIAALGAIHLALSR